MHSKLKPGGKIIFYVPNENCETEYVRSEYNNHLFTWNCLNLGNLFKAAGYFVYSVERIQTKWPDNYWQMYHEVGEVCFDFLKDLNGVAHNENRCLIVAFK